MKELKLLKLTMKNFQGIKEFELDAKGESLMILGKNESGKTRIVSAFTWLLFGKDALDRADFEIKTLDANNDPVHRLDHVVEGVFLVGGHKVTLKKEYKEKWTKKRGSRATTLTGHTTSHYVNGVRVKAREYQNEINDIVGDEKVFRLLTDPTYFNEALHWSERRQALIDACGGITETEVLRSNQELKKLAKEDNMDIKDYKSIIKDRIKELDGKIDKVSSEIDILTDRKPDIEGFDDIEQIKEEIADTKTGIQQAEAEIEKESADDVLEKKCDELKRIQQKLEDAEYQHKSDIRAKIEAEEHVLDNKREKADKLSTRISKLKPKLADLISRKQSLEVRVSDLTDNWESVWNEVDTFKSEKKNTCKSCGQSLPREMVSKAKKTFMKDKSMVLENIKAEVTQSKESISQYTASIEALNKVLDIDLQKHDTLANDCTDLNKTVCELKDVLSEVPNSDEYKSLKSTESTKLAEISKIEGGDSVNICSDSQKRLTELRERLEELTDRLYDIKTYIDIQTDIDKLLESETKLSKTYDELEEQKSLIDIFEQTESRLLEEKVNKMFKRVRFKMFETTLGGERISVCETLGKTREGAWVPYSGGLNNGNRIKSGLEIIKVLSSLHKFAPLIFVDNAESITDMPKMDRQLIGLFVSPAHDNLTVIKAEDVKDCEQHIEFDTKKQVAFF